MLVKFNIRRSPNATEENVSLNKNTIINLSKIKNFWGKDKELQKLVLSEGDFVRCLHLSHPQNMLIDGLFGEIRYAVRYQEHQYQDLAKNDDQIILTIDTKKIDYISFCYTTLPYIIDIFGPYRIGLETNKGLVIADWEIACDILRETGIDQDERDVVYRIWPVAYYDDLLCKRAFKLSAVEVVKRASPECERAELINDGAFLVVTSEIITDVEALEALNTRIRTCLAA